MKKLLYQRRSDHLVKKIGLKMKLSVLIFFSTLLSIQANDSYSQETRISLHLADVSVERLLEEIESNTEFRFVYRLRDVDLKRRVSIQVDKEIIEGILNQIFNGTRTGYEIIDRQVFLLERKKRARVKPIQLLLPSFEFKSMIPVPKDTLRGTVVDESGNSLIGVNIHVKGTNQGTSTDIEGKFVIEKIDDNAVLVFSYIGYQTLEFSTQGKSELIVQLKDNSELLEEVVVIGYGSQSKSDLTGSVVRADIESFREAPNVSIMQSLQGSVPGLNIGQVTSAGDQPNLQIRGRTSLSGELKPLIVLDGVIYRGNISDINPHDIKSVDVLKDASAAAIYGSQASNGVIILTSKKGVQTGKPLITLASTYTSQSPTREFRTGSPEDYLLKVELSDLYNSRLKESGYTSRNPDYDPTSKFKTNDEINAYNQGRSDNWYDIITNDKPYIQNHNLSLSNSSEWNNYYVSLGFTDQTGYLKKEGFQRLNARVNLEATVSSWLHIGLQSSLAKSNYLGQTPSPGYRYLSPFATVRDENGELIQIPGGNTINPLLQMEADFVDERMSLFGNLYGEIDFPFLEGLTYKGNYLNNQSNNGDYFFRDYASNFQGEGSKREQFTTNWSSDHIVSYKNTLNGIHNIFLTLVYGAEGRNSRYTQASSSIFANPILSYHNLQSGSADQQRSNSGSWKETSIYQMARLFYGFNYKYLITATVRRDGFSGFGAANKFGIFPSLSVAWVASEENFISNNFNWLDNLKVRLSYGANGNRTIGRYQTLANIVTGFNYITADGTPVYTQYIGKLASPNLKWETTTGINLGIDFGFLYRISGSIDYYNNETTNLLYNVDIPGIGRFQTFPDNLGRIHNQGIDISITSVNLERKDLRWESTLVFSRNRNELRELLGFDVDGDGKEDDLISEGLFIGEALDAIYDYRIDGIWQLDDEIPAYSDLGAYRVLDINGNGGVDPDDRVILGYREPDFRFSFLNSISYKGFTLRLFLNSIQGGRNRYLGVDDINSWGIVNQENHFNNDFPLGLDFWTPENPNARYERPNIDVSAGLAGTRYTPRSFVRLQDISLSYNVPSSLLSSIGVANLKIFLSGKNLVTWTKWPGWDPETGSNISRSAVPVMKGYSAGINLSF